MKRLITIILLFLFLFSGCANSAPQQTHIAATTLPVYQFTSILCEGTPLQVSRLISESVSCLHDYSLTVPQMRIIEESQVVVVSGAGLEDFMSDLLADKDIIDSSAGIDLLKSCHSHDHVHNDEHSEHQHDADPHIWLSPSNAKQMAENICAGLCSQFPAYTDHFLENLIPLQNKLDDLDNYAIQTLQDLSCTDMITFHDGFSYLAQAYGLQIVMAIEEESGSEASAQQLIDTIELVRSHGLTAVFTEVNGSASAAQVISKEIDLPVYSLDMAMAGDDYFESMYHNIDSLKEALQ